MAKLAISFHAIPEEVIDLASEWKERFDLHLVALQFFPTFQAEQIKDAKRLLQIDVPRRICLSRSAPNVAARSLLEFMNRNPDSLVIDIGQFSRSKLGESSVSAQGANAEFDFWKTLASELRKRTKAGMWAHNPTNGAKRFYPQHRYTARAANLAEQGAELAAATGWNLFSVEEPNQPANHADAAGSS